MANNINEGNIQKIFGAEVRSAEIIAKQIKRITFNLGNNFSFLPGQYVWVEILELVKDDPKGNRRAFSICNTESDINTISIIAKASESGYKKSLFSLKPGDKAIIHGPFGSSFVLVNKKNNIIMIAGGTGIAPFLTLIESFRKSVPVKCFLVYLNRSLEETPFLKELEKFKRDNSFFDYKAVYNYFSWKDVEAEYKKNSDVKWLISGPKAMVDYVYNELLKSGVSYSNMVFESFYPTPEHNLTYEKIQKQLLSEGILTQAIQNSTNHTIITDANGVILFANKAAEDMTGYRESEMLGNTPRLWGGLNDPDFYVDFWKKKKSGIPFAGEVTNRKKNGELYTVIFHISQIFDDARNIIGYIGTEEDITQQKKQIFELERGKVKDDSILESVGEGLVFTNRDGLVELMNPTAEKMFNLKISEVIDKPVSEVIVLKDEKGEIVPGEKRPLNIALNNKKVVHATYGYAPKKGIKFIAAITSAPVVLGDEVIGAIDVFRDVTKELEVDKAKTEFVSLASHQLKTPVTAIKWYADMLLSGNLGKLNKKQKDYLKVVYTSNERMINLIDNLLNVSRIDLGKLVAKKELVDLKALLKALIKEQRADILKKKHKLIIKQSAGSIKLMTDPTLLRTILQNFISNAVKYTSSKGRIVCTIKKNGPKILLSVKDNGIGIPTDEQKRIFEKLFRASNAADFVKEGNGLGLYMAKKMAEILKGKIWFESQSGKGTTFYLELPMK